MNLSTLSTKVKIIILSGLILCIALASFWYLQSNQNASLYKLTNPELAHHSVILEEGGFVPKELVIRPGDSVTFKTTRNVPFWPASSLHPSHAVYPEFDAKLRIKADESWEFLFDKIGEWNYHDHITSRYTGKIIVLNENSTNKPKAEKQLDCTTLTGYERTQCWDRQLKDTVNNNGVDAGFDFLLQIYKAEKNLDISCHEWVHILGEASYEVFASGQDVYLRPETAWCSYGYFHGFMTALIADTGNMEKVVDFCTMAVAQLEDELPVIESNCLHGIGHVAVSLFFEKPEYWGEFQKTAESGFGLCESLFSENYFLEECYIGVIHELRFSMINGLNGMHYDSHLQNKDPYYYCRNQKNPYQNACYSDFASMFWDIFDADIAHAVTYILDENISDSRTLNRTLRTLTTGWVEHVLPTNSYQPLIEACRAVPNDIFTSCFLGIMLGFIQHGEPNNLHTAALSFCRNDHLYTKESSLCFTQTLELLDQNYTQQQMTKVCSELTSEEKPPQCSN